MTSVAPIIKSDAPAVRAPIPRPPATGNIDLKALSALLGAELVVVDTETTGIDPDADGIVEIALVRIRNGEVVDTFHSLVNPGFPIPPQSSAVHNITDDMVAGKPTLEELRPTLQRLMDGAMPVAHNAAFDALFVDPALGMTPDPKRWLCSFRLARHTLPEAPAFGNMTLRYWFKTDPKTEGLGAHRAIDDVYVTVENLGHILSVAQAGNISTLEAAREFANSPIQVAVMPFGKHVGVPLAEIPTDYFEWALQNMQDLDDDLRHSMRGALEGRADRGRKSSFRGAAGGLSAGASAAGAAEVVPATVMSFGKHSGKPMSEVPHDYLEWMKRERPRCAPDVMAGALAELERRAAAPRPAGPKGAPAPGVASATPASKESYKYPLSLADARPADRPAAAPVAAPAPGRSRLMPAQREGTGFDDLHPMDLEPPVDLVSAESQPAAPMMSRPRPRPR